MPWSNGTYLAFESTSTYSIVLRIDLNPDPIPFSYISLDLYVGKFAADPDDSPTGLSATYIASFRSKQLPRFSSPPEKLLVTLTRLPNTWEDNSQPTDTINLQLQPVTDPDAADYLVSYRDTNVSYDNVPSGNYEFHAGKPIANLFHEVRLYLDTQLPAFPSPFAVEDGLGGPTFDECFRKAGLRLRPVAVSTLSPPQSGAWDLGALADQETKRGIAYNDWTTTVYLMIVSGLIGDTGTTGAMFDTGRGAAAVFYGTLKSRFSDPELSKMFVFTAVHETGHSLNLPHAFERSALPNLSAGTATFMNYPQLFSGNYNDASKLPVLSGASNWTEGDLNKYRNFWSVFTYDFDPQELLELRHGPRRNLVTGSDFARYRGVFTNTETYMSLGGSDGFGLALTLRFRGNDRAGVDSSAKRKADAAGKPRSRRPREQQRPIFDFGEPIHIEAELHSDLNKPLEVKRRLSPMTGDLEIHYETPDHKFLTYRPAAALCYISTAKTLNGENLPDQPHAFHKDVCLNLSGRGFQFLHPGIYRVRASYRYGDTQLVSNVLELFVRYPTRKVENLIVPLLDADVSTYLAFRGMAENSRARGKLKDTFLDLSGKRRTDTRHPLQDYVCAYEAHLPQDDQTRRMQAIANALGIASLSPSAVESLTAKSLAKLPFSNIGLSKLGKRVSASTSEIRVGLVSGLTKRFDTALALRGVPNVVRDRLKRQRSIDADSE